MNKLTTQEFIEKYQKIHSDKYDDEQHFKPIKFFCREDGLKYRQNNDAIKDEYCNKNNINLLRIKYNDNIQKNFGGTH